METNLKKYCESGGCSAKLGPELLHKILSKLPEQKSDHLLIGFESSDDAAVYKLTEDIALVSTLDFFTPMVEDPYLFGKIAAANALSDIYAMGADVKFALNIVCFPQDMDANILGEILRGGQEKVTEAGGILVGGHSINDDGVKYGLSVTGTVDPKKVLANNSCKIGDKIILTKRLGAGIIMTAYKVGECSEQAYLSAALQMETLNKTAADVLKKYPVSACTDVTGFGFLGHLNEMVSKEYSMLVDIKNVPYIPEALTCANNFIMTASGQRNRNYLKDFIELNNVAFGMTEILFDPQTSGGLLISVRKESAEAVLQDLRQNGVDAQIVAEVVERREKNIYVG